MDQSITALAGGRTVQVLRSIEHRGGKVSVCFRHGDLEVMLVEVDGGQVLIEPTLWGRPAWHLVLEGQALIRLEDQRWELLPGQSVRFEEPHPCTVVNLFPDRLKLLSVVVSSDAGDGEGAP